MKNVLTIYLNRKMIMRNGILGLSVGAYCIRPLWMSPKGTYDQKSRYIWGIFNTPIPWRMKRSITKINFEVMQNGMILFLIRKMFMQNRLYLYWNRKRGMRNGTTFFLIWKMFMQNRLSLYLDRRIIMQNRLSLYLNWKMVMWDDITLFLIIKRIMRNGIFGISVGAYCIRPLKTP